MVSNKNQSVSNIMLRTRHRVYLNGTILALVFVSICFGLNLLLRTEKRDEREQCLKILSSPETSNHVD